MFRSACFFLYLMAFGVLMVAFSVVDASPPKLKPAALLPVSTKVWTFSVQSIKGSGNNLANGLNQRMHNPNAGLGGWTDGSLWRTTRKAVAPGNWELTYNGTTATLSWVNYLVDPNGKVTGKYVLHDANLYNGQPKTFALVLGLPANIPNRGPNWPAKMKLSLVQ